MVNQGRGDVMASNRLDGAGAPRLGLLAGLLLASAASAQDAPPDDRGDIILDTIEVTGTGGGLAAGPHRRHRPLLRPFHQHRDQVRPDPARDAADRHRRHQPGDGGLPPHRHARRAGDRALHQRLHRAHPRGLRHRRPRHRGARHPVRRHPRPRRPRRPRRLPDRHRLHRPHRNRLRRPGPARRLRRPRRHHQHGPQDADPRLPGRRGGDGGRARQLPPGRRHLGSAQPVGQHPRPADRGLRRLRVVHRRGLGAAAARSTASSRPTSPTPPRSPSAAGSSTPRRPTPPPTALPTLPDGSFVDLPRSTNLGADWAATSRDAEVAFLKLDQELPGDWELRGALNYAHSRSAPDRGDPQGPIFARGTTTSTSIQAQKEGWDETRSGASTPTPPAPRSSSGATTS